MDFPNERYVRLFTRHTTTWRLLGWQGQALLPQLLMLVDRSGVLELAGRPAAEAVHAHLPGWPESLVDEGLTALLREGVLESLNGALVWPRFLEAQECQQSDAQRQRESRARRREVALFQGATPKEAKEAARPDYYTRSRNVTNGHTWSHVVTPGHSVPSLPSLPSQKKRERGSRLPEDWQPAPKDRSFAEELRLDTDAVTARFRDYWVAQPGQKGVKLDWSATWRNWCRRAAENGEAKSRKPRAPSPAEEEERRKFLEDPEVQAHNARARAHRAKMEAK